MADVELIRPVRAGPILTEQELNEEEASHWLNNVEYVMLPALDAAVAADGVLEVSRQAEESLNSLEDFTKKAEEDHRQTHNNLGAARGKS